MAGGFDRRAIPAAAREGFWNARDGHPIRRIDWPDAAREGRPPRGSLLFVPGRGDSYEKYLETLDYWHRRGWRVTALDWRWQAGSGRLGSDRMAGDVSDFAVWVADLAEFWEDWSQGAPGPRVIAGHSMGGHLVLRTLVEHRIDPVAAVLSAPMLGFTAPIPNAIGQAVARLMCRIGDPARMAWKFSEKPGSSPRDRSVLLTHDPERYADELWWREQRPELAMGPGTWRWVERAYASMRRLFEAGRLESVTLPVLILAARYDGLVGYKAIERAAKRLPRAQLATWGREAYHELLREEDAVRDRVIAAIDDFLDRLAPAEAG
ncbi:MAG: alpha/beta hydrolase [Sphingomonadales bacterium]|nr:alpha/beta hydrolase [Sphingomonadales bacterium]MDE2567628.1 alpha/beta hydrolase [Sphingomonadales bacterium]